MLYTAMYRISSTTVTFIQRRLQFVIAWLFARFFHSQEQFLSLQTEFLLTIISLITRYALRAYRVYKWARFLFLFFMVASNLHINLFIKLCRFIVGMYCSDCLQQKRPNENPSLARISRGRGPPHPYLGDVKSSFDLFIKSGLYSALP